MSEAGEEAMHPDGAKEEAKRKRIKLSFFPGGFASEAYARGDPISPHPSYVFLSSIKSFCNQLTEENFFIK